MIANSRLPKYFLLIIVFFLFSCLVPVAPTKVAVWSVPNRFTQDDVFKAAIEAGFQQGFQLIDSNPEYGTISLRRKVAQGERNVAIILKSVSGVIQVEITTGVHTGGGLLLQSLAGKQSDMCQQFYGYIFDILGITDGQDKYVNIKLLK